ncbi:MAG: hypothetical protein ACRC7N_16960, partial [Clostridium sp.]
MNGIRNNMTIINDKINSIYSKYKNKIYNDNMAITNIGYAISYLDEIQGNINTHFYGLGILSSMIEDNLTFYKFEPKFKCKINYFTLRYILDFNQKRIYTMFNGIKGFEYLQYPSEFSCNNDNHDI